MNKALMPLLASLGILLFSCKSRNKEPVEYKASVIEVHFENGTVDTFTVLGDAYLSTSDGVPTISYRYFSADGCVFWGTVATNVNFFRKIEELKASVPQGEE